MYNTSYMTNLGQLAKLIGKLLATSDSEHYCAVGSHTDVESRIGIIASVYPALDGVKAVAVESYKEQIREQYALLGLSISTEAMAHAINGR